MLVLEGEDDLAGLPEFAARRGGRGGARARPRGQIRHHAVALVDRALPAILDPARSSREGVQRVGEPRRKAANQQPRLIAETIRLRNERARLMGYDSVRRIFVSPTRWPRRRRRCRTCSNAVWEPALRRVAAEEQALQALIAAEGGNFGLAPWDWRHYAERLRKAEFDFDEAELKPYLQLDNIIAAAFDVAGRLFGLSFEEDEGPQALPAGSARLACDRQGRQVRRRLHRRLFRPLVQAERRLDVGPPRPAQARSATCGRSCST